MKKTLLLFAMLLGVVGAWAQVVTPTPGVYYYIQSVSNSKYLSTKNRGTSDWNLTVVDNQTDAGIYELIASGNNTFKLKCVNPFNGDCYIRKTASSNFHLSNNNDTNFSLEEQDGSFYIVTGGKYLGMGNGIVANAGSKDNADKWQFVLVVEKQTKTLALTSTELRSGSSIYTYHDNINLNGSNWYGKLQTKTTPKVVIEAEDKKFNGVGWSNNQPYLKQGAAYNISVPAGYKITEYSMTTSAGQSYTGTYTYTTSGEPATSQAAGNVNVTGLSTNNIRLELTPESGDKGIIISNLNITYEIEQVSYSLTDDAGNVYTGSGLKCYDKDELAIGGVDEYTLSNGILENGVYTANISFPVPVSKTDGSADKGVIICAYKGTLNPGVAKYFVDGDTQIKANPSAAVADKKDRWVIYPTCANGNFTFAIKNVGTGTYIKSNFDNVQKDAEDAVVVAESGYTNFTISEGNRFRVPVTKNGVETYLSVGSSRTQNKVVGLWSWYGGNTIGNGAVHNGISNFVYEAQLPYVITEKDNSNIKFFGTIDASTGNPNTLTPTITGVPSNWLSAFTFDGMKKTATIDFPFQVSSETVSDPIIIGAYSGYTDNFYWHSVGNNVMVEMNPEVNSSNIASYLWNVYPNLEGEMFTFTFKNIATNSYIHTDARYDYPEETTNGVTPNGSHDKYQITLNGTPTKFFVDSEKRFYYTVTFDDGVTYRKQYLSHSSSTKSDYLGIWTSGHAGTKTDFPSVSYTATIGEVGYTTLYSPIPVIFNDQYNTNTAEYYAITSETTGNTVSLTDMREYSSWYGYGDYIPANQGAILKGNPGTYTFSKIDPIEEFDNAWSNNKLKGSFTNTYVADDAYVLANGANGVGLYKADLNFYNVDGVWTKETEDAENGTHFKNNAGKAYLPASALSAEAAESRFFLFGFGDGEETGITETENGKVKTENTVVYDLAGRRVQGAQKGIFIVNGKKVVR